MTYDPAEQDEIILMFADMLRFATRDGGKKRAAGTKPSWKVDPEHEAAMFSHLNAWKHGVKADKDSGAHPLIHLAWRALAIAWQEDRRDKHSQWHQDVTEAETAAEEFYIGPVAFPQEPLFDVEQEVKKTVLEVIKELNRRYK